jgi:hypothetical protein
MKNTSTHLPWQILVKLPFSRQIFVNTQKSNFMKIHSFGADLFHADGQTYRRLDMTKLTDDFAVSRTHQKWLLPWTTLNGYFPLYLSSVFPVKQKLNPVVHHSISPNQTTQRYFLWMKMTDSYIYVCRQCNMKFRILKYFKVIHILNFLEIFFDNIEFNYTCTSSRDNTFEKTHKIQKNNLNISNRYTSTLFERRDHITRGSKILGSV